MGFPKAADYARARGAANWRAKRRIFNAFRLDREESRQSSVSMRILSFRYSFLLLLLARKISVCTRQFFPILFCYCKLENKQ